MAIFVRFVREEQVSYGVLENEIVRPIQGEPFGAWQVTEEHWPLAEVQVLSPIVPGKIIGVGLNYLSNINALKAPIPEEPVIFLKPPSSVIGPDENIIYPREVKQLAYEVELAVIIKEKAKNVKQEDALNHVLGYCCANDLTARDKMVSGPWTKAKSYDTFQPLGPYIVTDVNPDNLNIEMYLNGEKTQSSNTSDMVFNAAYLISYISSIMTLEPGDVILTGTPPGGNLLKLGDCIEAKIEGIGSLKNTVVGEA